MADVFAALADHTRRDILCLLEQGPLDAGQIADQFDISKPAISKHLRRLRECELVVRQVSAQRRIYSLNPAPLDEVGAWIAARQRAWEGRLDRLESFLNRQKENIND